MTDTEPNHQPHRERPSSGSVDDSALAFEVREICAKCERLAIVYDPDGRPLCARHGAIFVTDFTKKGRSAR